MQIVAAAVAVDIQDLPGGVQSGHQTALEGCAGQTRRYAIPPAVTCAASMPSIAGDGQSAWPCAARRDRRRARRALRAAQRAGQGVAGVAQHACGPGGCGAHRSAGPPQVRSGALWQRWASAACSAACRDLRHAGPGQRAIWGRFCRGGGPGEGKDGGAADADSR